MALLRTLPVARTTEHELIQPAREGRLHPELCEASGQLDAGLLRDVLGIRPMATPLPREAIDRVVVQVHQLGEGGDVPALCTLYETA